MTGHSRSIGIFDSGVGGLSIAAAIHSLLPEQPILYLADQANVPYGPRSLEEVRQLAIGISLYLRGQGARLIVVACNTASAAALSHLRSALPDLPFVGMEPAVKPAVERTISGKVGVLATPATFQGALYASLLERFAREVTIFEDTCPGLVAEIEAGRTEGPEARRILAEAIEPMLSKGVDRLVLGCTHYPFVIPLIRSIAGPDVEVIDPSPAVARQVERVLDSLEASDEPLSTPVLYLQTTGRFQSLEAFLKKFPDLFGTPLMIEEVSWVEGKLVQ
jgi:glutamate racemase